MNKKPSFVFSVVKETVSTHPFLSTALLIAVVGTIVAALYPPLVLEQIVNQLTSGQSLTSLLIAGYFGLLLLSGLFNTAQQSLLTIIGQKATHLMRSKMQQHLAMMPAGYFTDNQPGNIVSRFVNDVNAVETLFAEGIISIFCDAGKMIGIFVIICTKSIGLALILAVVTPLLFIMTRQFQKRMLAAQLQNRQAVGKVNDHVPQTIKTIRMIHTFHKEKYMEDNYDAYIQKSYTALEKSNFFDSIYSPIIITCSSLIIAAMMTLAAYGGVFQSFFGLTVGSAVAIISYVNQIFEPLEAIGMEIQNVQSALAGLYRINEFMHQPVGQPTDPDLQPAGSSQTPALQLDRVNFGYDADQPILHQVSLTIMPGENVTLTGRTGAGKSTIFKLLLGLYAPDSGMVAVNGCPAWLIDDSRKRRLFGYVEQSFHPVLGNLAQQITLGDSSLTEDDIARAIDLVGLTERISQLPQGYQTAYDPTLFSQGQWQLLAISRAIVANPSILLLDEITANLDSATEQMVLTALQKASAGRTVLSISHRLYEKVGGRLITLNN